MRFVALALILASLPVFLSVLARSDRNRDWAVAALGLLMFLVGDLQTDAALMSWAGWPGTSGGIVISPVDTLAIALIATRKGVKTGIPFAPIALLGLVPIAISIFVSDVPIASSFKLIEGFQLILFATAMAGELTRPSALPRLMQGLSVGLIIQAGLVVQQKLSGVIQASGSLGHQNSLGMMVELSLLPLAGYLLEGGKGKLCYAGAGAGLLIAAGGGSRGTLLFLAVGIVILVILSLMRGMTARKAKALSAGLAAAVVIAPLTLGTLKERFGDRAMVTAEAEREAFERAAIAMAADHPLGVGANTYVTVANTKGYSQAAGVIWNAGSRSASVHNVYLLYRAETGRLGEILLYILIGVGAWYGIAAGRRARAPLLAGATIGSAAAAIALLAHNHYEYVYAFSAIQRLFWLNLAIVVACMAVDKQLVAAARRRRQGAAAPRARVAPAGGGEPPGRNAEAG